MIDLHAHSDCSDGQYEPEILVQKAKNMNIRAFSVSDHDDINGSIRAIKKGREIGVQIISAVEMSVSFQGKVLHLFGYDFDVNDGSLVSKLSEIKTYRTQRAHAMIDGINNDLKKENKEPIDIEMILQIGMEKPITRVDIAQHLLDCGYVTQLQEAFDRWLNKNNIPNKDFSMKQGIDSIHNAGGVAVLAHPWGQNTSLHTLATNLREQVNILMKFQSAGLDGIEAYRFGQSPEIEKTYLQIANDLDFIATGGSDFHGSHIPGTAPDIGNNRAPDDSVDMLLERGFIRKKG